MTKYLNESRTHQTRDIDRKKQEKKKKKKKRNESTWITLSLNDSYLLYSSAALISAADAHITNTTSLMLKSATISPTRKPWKKNIAPFKTGARGLQLHHLVRNWYFALNCHHEFPVQFDFHGFQIQVLRKSSSQLEMHSRCCVDDFLLIEITVSSGTMDSEKKKKKKKKKKVARTEQKRACIVSVNYSNSVT
jgi:hypothetical protein